MKFDIAITTYKRIRPVFRLLESIRRSGVKIDVYCYIDNLDIETFKALSNDYSGVSSVLYSKRMGIFSLWNEHLAKTDAQASIMLADDVEFKDGMLQYLMSYFSNFSNEGVLGIRQDDMGFGSHPSAFTVVGNKFASRFPIKRCFFPDYKFHGADTELYDYASMVGEWSYTDKTIITHYKNEHVDTSHEEVGSIRDIDHQLYEYRRTHQMLWGRDFKCVNQ